MWHIKFHLPKWVLVQVRQWETLSDVHLSNFPSASHHLRWALKLRGRHFKFATCNDFCQALTIAERRHSKFWRTSLTVAFAISWHSLIYSPPWWEGSLDYRGRTEVEIAFREWEQFWLTENLQVRESLKNTNSSSHFLLKSTMALIRTY